MKRDFASFFRLLLNVGLIIGVPGLPLRSSFITHQSSLGLRCTNTLKTKMLRSFSAVVLRSVNFSEVDSADGSLFTFHFSLFKYE